MHKIIPYNPFKHNKKTGKSAFLPFFKRNERTEGFGPILRAPALSLTRIGFPTKPETMQNPYGKLTIDLSALRDNYAQLQTIVGPSCRVSAVVKANGYGLGMVEVAGALLKEGCQDFFVANIEEAVHLRASYKDCHIYALNGFYQSFSDLYLEHHIIPVLGSFIEVKNYAALSAAQNKALPAFLHFNTRMNRLGFGKMEQDQLWDDMSILDGIDVRGVMSHLACADEPDHPLNQTQLDLFQTIASHFPDVPKSLANSSGIFLGQNYHFDMVRPGAALYGVDPMAHQKQSMAHVVSLKLPVLRTRIVYQDAIVGYDATYQFEKDTPIATVSAGYADGIFRSLSNQGALYWKGMRCPIRGRVSMDLTTVDLSEVPENERPRPGDYLELLGPHQNADDLGRDAGTIGRDVLTHLGHRYKRNYINP